MNLGDIGVGGEDLQDTYLSEMYQIKVIQWGREKSLDFKKYLKGRIKRTW